MSTMAQPSTWSEKMKLTSSPRRAAHDRTGTWSILWWWPQAFRSVSTASSSCSSHVWPSALPCNPSKFFEGHLSHPPQSCVSDTCRAVIGVNSLLSSSLDIDDCSSVPSPFTTFCKLSLLSCRWNTFSSMEPVARKRQVALLLLTVSPAPRGGLLVVGGVPVGVEQDQAVATDEVGSRTRQPWTREGRDEAVLGRVVEALTSFCRLLMLVCCRPGGRTGTGCSCRASGSNPESACSY